MLSEFSAVDINLSKVQSGGEVERKERWFQYGGMEGVNEARHPNIFGCISATVLIKLRSKEELHLS